jgi:hypothetical protein
MSRLGWLRLQLVVVAVNRASSREEDDTSNVLLLPASFRGRRACELELAKVRGCDWEELSSCDWEELSSCDWKELSSCDWEGLSSEDMEPSPLTLSLQLPSSFCLKRELFLLLRRAMVDDCLKSGSVSRSRCDTKEVWLVLASSWSRCFDRLLRFNLLR